MLKTVELSQPWQIRPLELAVWAGVMFCAGIMSLWSHGQPERASEVRMERAPVSRQTGSAPAVNAIAPAAGRLNLNTATEAELEMLPGIGRGRAKAIVKERNRRGAFRSIWELSEVKGLTKALVQRIEPLVQVQVQVQPQVPPPAPANLPRTDLPIPPSDSPRP